MKIRGVENIFWAGLFSIVLTGCIIEYVPNDIDEINDILVVEGIITDYETVITLSRSVILTQQTHRSSQYIDNATVYVERDDGMLFLAENALNTGQYTVNNGALNPENKYRLKIEIMECDFSDNFSGCNLTTNIYQSDFLHPIITPQIDSLFYTKDGKMQPVMIHIDTRSNNRQVMFYNWSYREDWEYTAIWRHPPPAVCPNCFFTLSMNVIYCPSCSFEIETLPYICWRSNVNNELLLGSNEKTSFGRYIKTLYEVPAGDLRLSRQYRIEVKQRAISKRAYDYFSNMKNNIQMTGSIFTPIPSEIRGNIICVTSPERPVIGYMEVSTTANIIRYISHLDNLYEAPHNDCEMLSYGEMIALIDSDSGRVREDFAVYYTDSDGIPTYTLRECIDCTVLGGTTESPDDWGI